jgi:hypothetical protein
MKLLLACPVAVMLAFVAAPAGAQLVSERVENNRRICTYRVAESPAGGREYSVALGEACAAFPPARRTNGAPPPTARLESVAERNGRRVCSYAERSRRWSFNLPLDTRCPMNAGMIAALQSADPVRDN